MRLSVNELESLARKASVGAGLDHGHAAEAARSLLRLVAADFDGVSLLVRLLRARTAGATSPVARVPGAPARRLAPQRDRPACALLAAPALRDFAQVAIRAGALEGIECVNVAHPGWAIGQFSAGSWPAGLALRCMEPGGGPERWRLRAAAGGPALVGRARVPDDTPGDLLVTGGAGSRPHGKETPLDVDPRRLARRGVEIEPGAYHALRHYFHLTLVPDSDASRRHGAGAGLVDTD